MTLVDLKDPSGLARAWAPAQRREAARIAEKLPVSSRDAILEQAVSILARCAPPDAQTHRDVGLVVGYVQSGKTMSFTTLCALARDNHYPLIIVVTGTATNLLKQSDDRLVQDLVEGRDDRQWQHIPFDTRSPSPAQLLESSLQDWRDPRTPASLKRTTLITVLKNHANLRKLKKELQSGSLQDFLRGTPTLIVDDEADQASLNARVRQNNESSTYARIQELRASLPCHTYVQYTATPQAPVLISIIDALSPSWVEVLTPGADYTGGTTFFNADRPRKHIRVIPASEIYDPTSNPIESPPASFRLALATFFLGVATAVAKDELRKNRSMLVHPHQHVDRHGRYYHWAKALKTLWSRLLAEGGQSEPEYDAMIELFREAHSDLQTTCGESLPSFDDLRGYPLDWAVRSTNVQEVNAVSGQTPAVAFKNTYAHILVGGQAMDRGFTVEGLTVTYMPRGIGVGNADTIQQRARFFGYKRPYLGFCRVWLEHGTVQAMDSYVEHEESMRGELIRHQQKAASLKEWRRAFFLSPNLQPTRRQVLAVGYSRGGVSASMAGTTPGTTQRDWAFPRHPHWPTEPAGHNEVVIDALMQTLTFADDDGDDRRTNMQRHRVATVSVRRLYQTLSELKFAEVGDSESHTGMLLQLEEWMASVDPEEDAFVYQMAAGTLRARTIAEDDSIGPLMQGANPGTGYPGDRAIGSLDDLVVQVHSLELSPPDDPSRSTIESPIRLRVLAIALPRHAERPWLAQVQP